MINSIDSIINSNFNDLKETTIFCTYPEIVSYDEVVRIRKKVSKINYSKASEKKSIFSKFIKYFQ